jgi:hypothetical protein
LFPPSPVIFRLLVPKPRKKPQDPRHCIYQPKHSTAQSSLSSEESVCKALANAKGVDRIVDMLQFALGEVNPPEPAGERTFPTIDERFAKDPPFCSTIHETKNTIFG